MNPKYMLEPRTEVNGKSARRLVKKVKPEHLQAFSYWVSLGKNRTYEEVARHMGVKVATVKNWAFSFRWKEKLEEVLSGKDELFVELLREINDIRKDSILLIHKIHAWYAELQAILDKAIAENREPTEEERKKIEILRYAISCFDSKALRNLGMFFQTNLKPVEEQKPATSQPPIQVHGHMFVIREGKPKEEIVYDNETESVIN